MREKIESFVYYGADNYISLVSLRIMVPAAYLFLGFTGSVAGIVGRAIAPTAVFLSFILFYALAVYTFNIWCPSPSFSCRFAVSAFSTLSLSIILQSWAFLILLVAKFVNAWDIAIIALIQIVSAVICFFITKKWIDKGIYKAKKSFKSNINIAIIASAAVSAFRGSGVLRNIETSLAATIVTVIITFLAVLFAVIATPHLMKYFYCKTYNITCGTDNETTSPLLFAEKKEKKSLPNRIWSIFWKSVVAILLISILVGVYKAS